MRLPSALYHLSFSLLLCTFSLTAVASASVPTKLTVLTPENFDSTVSNGLWLIEHFSPYCIHCKNFLPTWEKLVEYVDSQKDLKVGLAQVDCVENGDLCEAHGVTGYPQVNLYQNGKFLERYRKRLDFEVLTEYLWDKDQKLLGDLEETKAAPPQVPNPSGSVLVLTPTTFGSTVAQGPTFIKFYAPWCGHCKKIAPTWIQLAKHMQNKLNIAEINCETHEAFCKSQNVQGFPMLAYYSHGTQTEYVGGRKFDQLKAFTEKASAPPVQPLQAADLTTKLVENEVAFLLLHPESDTKAVADITEAAAVLLGAAPVFESSDPSLFSKYSLSSSSSALLAFKRQTVAATYVPTASPSSDALANWFKAHSIPTALELTQDTFQQVMNAKHRPLVVLAAVTPETKDKVAEKLIEIGKKWVLRTNGGNTDGTRIVFTWMDAKRWEKWMKSMYGIKASSSVTNPPIVIADHQNLRYYDADKNDQPFQMTAPQLFAAVEDALAEKLKVKNSENFAERMARHITAKMSSLESFIFNKPFHSLFFFVAASGVVFLVLQRWLSADDIVHEYGAPHKTERLD